MSIYFVRMIELLSLASLNDDHYVQATLHTTSTQPIEVFWRLEPHIAKQVHIYCDFQVKSRYRLSLKAQPTAEGTTVATITKTHLMTSQRFDFSITAQFAAQLQQMNQCPNPIHLLQLPYIWTAEQFTELKRQEAEKPKEQPKAPLDLANLTAASAIQPKQVQQAPQQAEAPVFTYHASENSLLFTRLVQGSQAI